MREIAIVSVSRSDFGLYLPLLRAIKAHPALRFRLLVSGMHLSPEFGLTVQEIEASGFEVFERIESLMSSDTPGGVATAMGLGTRGFAQLFSRYTPDMLVVLGDRFDMLPAGLAALPFGIPVAHIHGGESTEGAIDEAIRHCLTKLSHLHFASTRFYAERIMQMGEEPWRVTVSGALGLDAIREAKLDRPEDIARQYGFTLQEPIALVTLHPESLIHEQTESHITNLLSALDQLGMQCLFTYPNADMSGRVIAQIITRFCKAREHCRVVSNLGSQMYFNLLNMVSIMVGNSSSGIIEAPSFRLPVVNLGQRQAGRLRAGNVIDCGFDTPHIVSAIRQGLDPEFRAKLEGLANPYGDGHAAERIVERLATAPLGQGLIAKRFFDHPAPTLTA